MKLIRHTGFFVNRIETMKDFYCKHFDMKIRVHDNESDDYIAKLYNIEGRKVKVELYKFSSDDGEMIELLKMHTGKTMDVHSSDVYNYGSFHIALTVKDIDGIYRELKKKILFFIRFHNFQEMAYIKSVFAKTQKAII